MWDTRFSGWIPDFKLLVSCWNWILLEIWSPAVGYQNRAHCIICNRLRRSIMFLFQSKLHMVTVLGSGLLVGTALAVIIPEGVNALYEEGSHRKYQYVTYCYGYKNFLTEYKNNSLNQGWIFIYLKGGVEKFLMGCKQHHSVSFSRG